MKTFKMLAFDLLVNDEIKEIPLTDGIIINQENSHKMWILELFTADTYYDFFKTLLHPAKYWMRVPSFRCRIMNRPHLHVSYIRLQKWAIKYQYLLKAV